MFDTIKTVIFNKLDQHRKDVLSGAVVSIITRLFGAGMQFTFNVILARLLGANGLGIYTLALSTSMIASVIGRMGMDLSILRHVAVHNTKEELGRLKQGWQRMISYAFIFSLLISVLLYYLSPLISSSVFSSPELTTPLRWMALSIVPFSLLNLYAESLRAIQRIGASSIIQASTIPVFSILIFLILFISGLRINAAILAYVTSSVITLIIAKILWDSALPDLRLVRAQDGPSFRKILEVSLPMTWVIISSVVMGIADTVILGIFRPANEVGIYTAALRISILLGFVLVGVNSILATKFASLYRLAEYVAIERLSQFCTKLMLLLVVPAALIIVLFPDDVLKLFGDEFRIGSTSLVILTLGQLFNVSVGSVGLLLVMTGHERRLQWINSIAVLCNILLALILVPTIGVIGAAISNTTGLVVINILALFSTMKYVGVSTVPGILIAGKK